MDFQAMWLAALGELELTLSKANFTTWFKNTSVSSIENGRAIISVPNTFTKAWLEKKYHDAIVKALRHATSNEVREATYRVEMRPAVMTEIMTEYVAAPVDQRTSHAFGTSDERAFEPVSHPASDDVGLNPRYTFDSFIVGKGNELAHAAALATAATPGEAYNPLFVYGGVGLGKTHLLQAIGHHIVKTRPNAVVRYVTSERFTNEFIQAVRIGKANDFKNRYRDNVDVLLVDDIQFLAGKQTTQEEFFHTFNTLHQANKQVIIASDRSPKEIQSLESRLLSRFEWGMITDISMPDFETRIAILEAKCASKNFNISGEILRLVAGAVKSNVRELEGALNKIIAYHQFKNIPPSQDTVQTLLQSFIPTTPKRSVTPRKLLEIIVSYYDIAMDDLLGKSREKRLAFPRQVAMFLLREDAKCSFPSIGSHLGDRDHTTAMHACSKIGELSKRDEQLRQDLTAIRERMYSEK